MLLLPLRSYASSKVVATLVRVLLIYCSAVHVNVRRVFSQFTIQCPGDLIYFPQLHAHAVLTLDTGSSTTLAGRDAASTSSQQIFIQTLDKYIFDVRRSKWRETFRTEGFSPLREWVFSSSTGPQESKEKLQKQCSY